MSGSNWQLVSGLSPLTRGTHLTLLPVSVDERFIPADAGNTAYKRMIPMKRAVYPR